MWSSFSSVHQPVERLLQAPEVPAGQAVRVELDRDAAAGEAQFLEDSLQVAGGIGVLGVPPDPDVLDRAGLAGLDQVGPARQQHDGPVVGGDDGALEEDEAAGVVAGEPEMAFLREDQHGVEAARLQRLPEPLLPREVLLAGEGKHRTGGGERWPC